MLELESLRIKILADASDLKKQTAATVADVQNATGKIAQHGADMAASIKRHCDDAAKSFEGVAQASQKAALQVKQAAASTLSDAEKIKQAMAIYNDTAPKPLAGLDNQFASAHAGLDSLKQTADDIGHMTQH